MVLRTLPKDILSLLWLQEQQQPEESTELPWHCSLVELGDVWGFNSLY
jgi:hypothetical protein